MIAREAVILFGLFVPAQTCTPDYAGPDITHFLHINREPKQCG